MADPKTSKSVVNQPRDRFGRWIAKGANIKWREDGRNKVGIVQSFLKETATVQEKNPDGTPTGNMIEVPIKDIQVLASKATIPSGAAKYEGRSDNLQESLDSEDFKNALAEEGSKTISTPSGYELEVKEEDDSGPLTYQLYAPNGKSLGIFSQEALTALQEMIDSAEKPVAGAPETAKGTVGADAPAVAPGAAGGFEVIEVEPKNFRVPPKVKQEISAVLNAGATGFSAEDLTRAKALAYDETVSMSDIKWIGNYFSEIEAAERLRGGFNGRKWASKVLDPQTPNEMFAPIELGIPYERYDFDDEVFDYFAVSDMEGSTESYALIAVDYETGAVYVWKENGFEYQHDIDLDTYEAPSIVPIDVDTALELAKYLDTSVDQGYDILDSDEEERNLFLAAEAELDYEEMGRVFAITADATGYTPQERSVNASRQKRGPGGKFGGGQAVETSEGLTPQYPKAKLTSELPLVGDIAAVLEAWLIDAPESDPAALTASGAFAEAPAPTATETPAEAPVEATPAGEEGTDAETAAALYFAIVDEVDKTAVMNAFAIIKQAGGPKAYLREKGAWAESPDVLSDIQGTTPPPVVSLEVPEPAKSVLAQIDQHDTTQTQEATDSEDQPAIVASALRGYALPDGSFSIHNVSDLSEAVKQAQSLSEASFEVKSHIRKRAKALNRMDIVPADWRTPSTIERGALLASASAFTGEFGEVLTAAGRRGRRNGAAELKRYWTIGKGAAKIRWGTKGDLTRAHRHLAKYVGPELAWGLVQNYHKSLFGMSNYKRDNG